MRALPRLMVAPNGARKTGADHPRLPVSIAEIVAETMAARDAGADGLHLHIRDTDGRHSLDAGLYRDALAALAAALPGFAVQITTEAAGRYTPAQQISLVDGLAPDLVSVAIRELTAEGEIDRALSAYRRWHARDIAVQHIVYTPADLDRLIEVLSPPRWRDVQILMVLGRYTEGQESDPADLGPFLARIDRLPETPDWGLCAFGRRETDCLVAAHRAGGKLRVGFENNVLEPDGTVAESNAARVATVIAAVGAETGARIGAKIGADRGYSSCTSRS